MAEFNVDQLVQQAIAEGNAETSQAATSKKVALPAGLHLDPAGSSINPFGILDKRVPSGFFTYVLNDNNDVVGFVQGGKYSPVLKPTAKKPAAAVAAAKQTPPSNALAVSNYRQATELQKTAEDEYNDLVVKAQLISRGGASQQDIAEFKRLATQYKGTIDTIRSAYEKSGAVQGDINLDKAGRLVTGSVIKDPNKPSEPAVTVTNQGKAPSVQPFTQPMTIAGAVPIPAAATGPAGKTGPTGPTQVGAGGKTPTSPTGATGATGAKSPEDIRADAVAKFGAQLALINSVPELGTLLDRAIKENWSAERWGLEYQNSKWFQSNSGTFRTYEASRLSDPGAFAEQYNNLLKDIQVAGKNLGIDTSAFGSAITADQAKSVDPNGLVGYLLSHYYNKGVPSEILNNYISSHGSIAKTGGVSGGLIASTAATLRNEARSQGLNPQLITPSWKNATMAPGADYFESAAQAIERGDTNQAAETNYYKQLAAATYKPFAKQIMDGTKVDALANPYVNTIANLLEVSPESVDLSQNGGYGSLVSKALQGDGNTAMTLDAFTSSVKQRPEWLNTGNARNSMMDTAYSLLRNFGLVVG